jgi:hypothetical protein
MHASSGIDKYLQGIIMREDIALLARRWFKFWKYFFFLGLTINRPVHKRDDTSGIQLLELILKAEA